MFLYFSFRAWKMLKNYYCINVFKCSLSIKSKVSLQHLYVFLFCEEVYYYYYLFIFTSQHKIVQHNIVQ